MLIMSVKKQTQVNSYLDDTVEQVDWIANKLNTLGRNSLRPHRELVLCIHTQCQDMEF